MYLESGILILKPLGTVLAIALAISGQFWSINLKHYTYYLQSSKVYHSIQRSMASILSTVQGFMPMIANDQLPTSWRTRFPTLLARTPEVLLIFRQL